MSRQAEDDVTDVFAVVDDCVPHDETLNTTEDAQSEDGDTHDSDHDSTHDQEPITIVFSPQFASAARRLRNAQGSDGNRTFHGTIEIRFTEDCSGINRNGRELLIIHVEDYGWKTASGEEIDTRTIRDPVSHA